MCRKVIWYRHEVKKEIAELEALLAGASQTSQSTLLLKKRKEMREVDEALELMKDEYKNRMDACEERRMQFEVKQAKMREQVLKFEKFIQENDAKRQRAEAKAKQERKLYEEKCKEMQLLMDKIVELERSQKELENQLGESINTVPTCVSRLSVYSIERLLSCLSRTSCRGW